MSGPTSGDNYPGAGDATPGPSWSAGPVHALTENPIEGQYGGSFDPQAADALAAERLGDLRTKLGGLHIAHARRVAEMVRARGDERLVAVALLHDVVEKGRCTLAELLARSRDERLVALVDILTRRDMESEEDYLARCAADPAALVVKRADLADKLFLDDVRVPLATAQALRQQAKERMVLLDQLASR